MTPRRRRNALLVAAAAAAAAVVGYGLYWLTKEEETAENRNVRKAVAAGSAPSTTVILLNLVMAAGLPFAALAAQPGIVFVLPPGVKKEDLLRDQVWMDTPGVRELFAGYKVVECGNLKGLWFLVRHLRSSLLFVVEDDLGVGGEVPEDIQGYVREVVVMAQNSNDIRESMERVVGKA